MTKKIYFVLFILMTYFQSFAVTAYPYPVEFTHPNGEQVTLIMKGDEFVKFAQTLDGYTLLYNSEGYFCYAQQNTEGGIEPSVFVAVDISKRSNDAIKFLGQTPKGLRFSKIQLAAYLQIREMVNSEYEKKAGDSKGTRRLLTILMGFKDRAFGKTNSDFNNLFNQANYTGYGARGSVFDFFYEASYGKLLMQVDVMGPYTASQNMAHYGSDSGDPRDLVAEAVHFAAPSVNYANYDNDGDGEVESIYIIFAGYGEEAGGSSDCIWSHAWGLETPITYDGVWISAYACSPELRGSNGNNITYIGVICHEFGHSLGAPDYYDTNYQDGGQYDGTGSWDLQAGGSWNDNGRTPALPNPRSKVVTYQWATATVLSSSQKVTVPVSRLYDNAYFRVNTATTGEYFIIECRKKAGFDSSIPGENLVIYRCASNTSGMNTTSPQKFYPVAANADVVIPSTGANAQTSYGTINSASCTWPTATKRAFTDFTKPSMLSWSSDSTRKPITNITANASSVTFDFMGGGTKPNFLVFLPSIMGCKVIPQPGSTSPVASGGNYSFKIELQQNYEESIIVVKSNGNIITPSAGIYTLTGVSVDQIITIAGVQVKTVSVTATANLNGTITPSGVVAVPIGNNQDFAIAPNLGYLISSVLVDNIDQGIIESYIFNNVQIPHTITANFVEGDNDFFILSTDSITFETFPGTASAAVEVTVEAVGFEGNLSIIIPAPFQGSLNGSFWLQSLQISHLQLPKTFKLRFKPASHQPGNFSDVVKIVATGVISKIVVHGIDKNIGINNYNNDNEVVIYPNPAKNQLIIDNGKLIIKQLEIYDITGKQLSTINYPFSTIDVSHLQAGIYFLKVYSESSVSVHKIVKE